jgi:hypothetical protein
MRRLTALTAGWGTGVAILAATIFMLLFIWTGDETWSRAGQMSAIVAGVPGFVWWLGNVKRNS